MKFIDKVKEIYDSTHNYIKTHLWVELISTVLLIFILVVLILQSYLKNQYFNYLVDETWKTEKTMLAVSASKLESVLKEALFVGGEIAIDGELKKSVDNILESDGNQLAREKMNLNSVLNKIAYYSSDVAAVTIVSEEGVVVEYGRVWAGSGISKLWIGDNLLILEDLYKKEMEQLASQGIEKYQVSTVPAFHDSLPDIQMFHIALPLLGRETSFDNIKAVVVVSFKLNDIIASSSISDQNYQDNVSVYMTAEDGSIIFHEDRDYIGKQESEYLDEKTFLEMERTLSYFNWVEHIVIDTGNMHNDVDRLYRRGVVVYIGLMILCVLLWQLMLRRVLKPINEIRNAMNAIKSGKVNCIIEIGGQNELWQLAEHYNEMVTALREQKLEVKRQFEEKTQSIKLQSKAEQEALESQINAHFLCNTLNAINYNAMEDGNYEVSDLLKKLSNILQYTFSKKSREVTIGQEIDWVKQYLYLQKYRKMDQFDYIIEYPEEYSEWPCCKLFLQPFVENSIIHGFEKIERGGLIKITGWEESGRLVIKIWDNGCGIEADMKAEIEKAFTRPNQLMLSAHGNGIGIKNVITRMRMYLGQEFEVKLDTIVGQETCFTFWLPIPKNSN